MADLKFEYLLLMILRDDFELTGFLYQSTQGEVL